MHFKSVIGSSCGTQNEISLTGTLWQDWIFAESQRRYVYPVSHHAKIMRILMTRRFANLWLLVGFAVSIKNGNICDATQSYRTLPLPSPKSMWEASTQTAWESEHDAYCHSQTKNFTSVGDLIDAQNLPYTPSNARKLDMWNARIDNLGCLLNLVASME